MPADRADGALIIFLGLLLASWAGLNLFLLASGFGATIGLLMWSVGLSAILALKWTGRSLGELGWNWGAGKYHLLAFVLPAAYCLLSYGGAWLLHLANFAAPEKVAVMVKTGHAGFVGAPFEFPVALAVVLCAGILQTMPLAIGEEIGWRGFLAPRLVALWGFAAGTLVTGVIWAAWHMPLIVLGNYNAGGDIRFELLSFAIMVLAMSGPVMWLRLRAQSFWPCATLHASHNLLVQGIFDPLAGRGPGRITMVGEFGVVMALTVLLVSLPFWFLGMGRQAGGTRA
jgi:membrane protease YdiL (CAAX protease family)